MSGAALIAGAVASGFWRWLRKAIKQPDVETESVVMALAIHDKLGQKATLTRTQTDIANRKVLSHTLSVGGIASNGTISEISVDGAIVPKAEWEQEVTLYRVTRTRQALLNPGERITREFQIQLENSFPGQTEILDHNVANKFKRLTLKVKFPPDRNPKSVHTFLAYGTVNHERLADPVLEADGFRAVLIEAPQLGGSYRIEWEW